jgi:hypothetical protein
MVCRKKRIISPLLVSLSLSRKIIWEVGQQAVCVLPLTFEVPSLSASLHVGHENYLNAHKDFLHTNPMSRSTFMQELLVACEILTPQCRPQIYWTATVHQWQPEQRCPLSRRSATSVKTSYLLLCYLRSYGRACTLRWISCSLATDADISRSEKYSVHGLLQEQGKSCATWWSYPTAAISPPTVRIPTRTLIIESHPQPKMEAESSDPLSKLCNIVSFTPATYSYPLIMELLQFNVNGFRTGLFDL